MKIPSIIAAALLGFNLGAANASSQLNCVQEKVVVTKADLSNVRTGIPEIVVSIRNDLDWAIGGIYLQTVTKSKDRSVPWNSSKNPISIRGGIEPGETREIIAPSIGNIDDDLQNVEVTATVLDVADSEMRLLIKDIRVMSWPDEQSDRSCS